MSIAIAPSGDATVARPPLAGLAPLAGPALPEPIEDIRLILAGFAIGALVGIEAIISRDTRLDPTERRRRAAALALLWESGCIRIMDEGLLADAVARRPDEARRLAAERRNGGRHAFAHHR